MHRAVGPRPAKGLRYSTRKAVLVVHLDVCGCVTSSRWCAVCPNPRGRVPDVERRVGLAVANSRFKSFLTKVINGYQLHATRIQIVSTGRRRDFSSAPTVTPRSGLCFAPALPPPPSTTSTTYNMLLCSLLTVVAASSSRPPLSHLSRRSALLASTAAEM